MRKMGGTVVLVGLTRLIRPVVFVVPTCTCPVLRTENLVAPDLDAVKRSPTPELPTRNEANDVAPDMVATGRVPEVVLRSRVPRREVLFPIPSLRLVASQKRLVLSWANWLLRLR